MTEENDKQLCEAAREALGFAFAPYSNFRVGAALRGKNGKIYSGCNVEISSYGLTICAERVALFKAVSEGVQSFESLVITAESEQFCPPCGACRQVLADFAPALRVILLNSAGGTEETSMRELLPHAFDRTFLDNNPAGR